MASSLAVRLQQLQPDEQVLVLTRIVEGRKESQIFRANEVDELTLSLGLPSLGKISNRFLVLERSGRLRRGKERGTWKLTPLGRANSESIFTQLDIVALLAEVAEERGASVGHTIHAVVPPFLAPPALIPRLHEFLRRYPFETNIFAMTRFPDDLDDASKAESSLDPISDALASARAVCEMHGFKMHLAFDRSIVDDLWDNVMAHIWASRYGIAFFEDRQGEGLNYNLTLEVGSMLVLGRRCALLKDSTIPKMPSDLVGKIYVSVDLGSAASVAKSMHKWFRDDLAMAPCPQC